VPIRQWRPVRDAGRHAAVALEFADEIVAQQADYLATRPHRFVPFPFDAARTPRANL
jgi:hypothetical protein